ncbi:MAG TPA: TetR family transcriptional regulator C-terminal domain-containing protein [Burkholderiales bacterium]|nr:TetR family transcriptional regulator C-terminal domain-containing protein [Burkholderiales bacterium]
MEQTHATKQGLLDAGIAMLLKHGYHDLGLQALLAETRVPKGSFYHHFRDKEDFALQVIDEYMKHVHAGLDACLGDEALPPLARVRRFFERVQKDYRREGYLGCLLGGLGQELSGVSDIFRHKVEQCFSEIARRIAVCLEEARRGGSIPADSDPARLAGLLVDCWEGAALRSRLKGSAAPLGAMLDFYFRAAAAPGGRSP